MEMRKLREHVDGATEAIEIRMNKKLDDRDKLLIGRIENLEARKPASEVVKPTGRVVDRREEAYNKCRRSLKMWPVKGVDLVDAVKVFMNQKLGIDDRKLQEIGQLVVTPSAGRLARDRAEVLVLFGDKDDRDYVKSTGINLAGNREAGMTIHVPGFLLDDLYALNSVGYNIKTTHKGVKRSVKFDDSNMGIFLDICINDHWKRIYPADAKKALKNANAPNNGNSRSISAEDLSNLIQGEPVIGLTAVVVPDDSEQDGEGQ